MTEQICPQCLHKFVPTNKRGPKPRFCSAACKQANYRGTWPDVYAENKRRKTRNVIAGAGSDPGPIQRKTSMAELLAENEKLLAECRKLREELHQ